MYILEQLNVLFPSHKVQLMYDIACVLVKHLQVRFNAFKNLKLNTYGAN